MGTKEKIIESAISVFNEQGYGSATLLDIADHLQISRGNLAYHFKDKLAILNAISSKLKEEIGEKRKAKRDYPAFSNLQVDIKSYYQLQKRYAFIFGNIAVLRYEPIKQVMKEWADDTIHDNVEAFAFAVKMGNMKPEPYPGLYHNLAVNTWMLAYYWLFQQEVRDVTNGEDAEKTVWSSIIPYFTDRGLKAFNSYFGEDYLKKLGKPLNQKLKEKILF
jgi:AcrR family transcriptional regulator